MSDDCFVRLNPTGPDQVRVVEELRRLGVRFVVIGGVAMGAYRPSRYTSDIDVIVPAGEAGRLADHLAAMFSDSRVQRYSLREVDEGRGVRGRSYYRVVTGRGRRTREIVDVAPADLYPQYGAAHASPRRPTVVEGYESMGSVQIAGREEMLAMKIRASIAPNRKYESRFQDEVDIMYLLHGADLARVRDLVADVPGGVEQLARMVAIRESRSGKKNPQARILGPSLVRCWSCGRSVPLVRGGLLKAHDFQYRRCAGSGQFA